MYTKTNIDDLINKVLDDHNVDNTNQPNYFDEVIFSSNDLAKNETNNVSEIVKIEENLSIDKLIEKVVNSYDNKSIKSDLSDKNTSLSDLSTNDIQKNIKLDELLDKLIDSRYENHSTRNFSERNYVNSAKVEIGKKLNQDELNNSQSINSNISDKNKIKDNNEWKAYFEKNSKEIDFNNNSKKVDLDKANNIEENKNLESINTKNLHESASYSQSKLSNIKLDNYNPHNQNWKKAFINTESEIDTNDTSDTIYFYSGNSTNTKNIPSWIPKSNFTRTETDLIATDKSGSKAIFSEYFTNHDLPSIETENGLLLKGSLLKALAGPLVIGQYAGLSSGDDILSIGEVSSIKGTAKATRLDGNIFTLSEGDPIFQGDLIETEGSGSVGLVFLDKTTMSLSDGGKMVLDELVYDPSTGDGSMAIDMLEGAFSFVSGEIAKTGPDAMSVSTPVATIGIRGTTVAGKAAVEGNENSFTLLQDAEGGVGQISVSNSAGTQTLSQVGATTSIASINAAPPPPIILSAAEIQANYGSALAVLPPTPVVAPQPQSAPPPQEQQQEESNQEDEENSEESSEELEGEEGESVAEGEEVSENEVDELAEGETEELDEEVPGEEPGEESVEAIDEIDANEAFETAMADGASPEEAMAEAAAAGGFEEGIDTENNVAGEPLLEALPGDPFGGDLSGDFGGDLGEAFGGEILDIPGGETGEAFGGEIFSVQEVDPGGAFGGETFAVPGGDLGGNAFGTGSATFGAGNFGGGISVMGGPSNEIFGPTDIFSGVMFGPDLGGEFFGSELMVESIFDTIIEYEESFEESYTENFYEDASLYETYEEPSEEEAEEETSSEESSSEESSGSSITGTLLADTLVGTSEADTIYGLDGEDTITGLAGNDIIYGGMMDDNISGGDDNDTLYGDLGNDQIHGNDGDDQIKGGDGSDILYGDSGDDIISGGSGTDAIYGKTGKDTITGGLGNDVIYGGLGEDKITGGGGVDTIYGGDSNDQFIYTELIDAGDVIYDFTTGDTMVFVYEPAHPYYSRTGYIEVFSAAKIWDPWTENAGTSLPTVINFTLEFDDIPNDDFSLPVEVSKAFDFQFYDSYNYYDMSDSVQNEFIIVTGDGHDTAFFHWKDSDMDGGFYYDDTELTMMAILEEFDNDSFTGTEITTSVL